MFDYIPLRYLEKDTHLCWLWITINNGEGSATQRFATCLCSPPGSVDIGTEYLCYFLTVSHSFITASTVGCSLRGRTGLTLDEGQISFLDFSLILMQHWFTWASVICKAHFVQQSLCNKSYLCLWHQSQDTGVVCLMSLKSVKLIFSIDAQNTHMSEWLLSTCNLAIFPC